MDARPVASSRRDLRIDPPSEPATRTLSVLMVCSGNICRSAMAEVLLRSRVGALDVRVHSAGTRAAIGRPMPDRAQKIVIARGASPEDAAAHRARWLFEPMLESTDLVLGMSRRQLTAVAGLAPQLRNQSFPLREFARLAARFSDAQIREVAAAAGDEPHGRLAAVLTLLDAERRLLPPSSAADDDVTSPYKRGPLAYRASTAQLMPGVDAVARVLRVVLG